MKTFETESGASLGPRHKPNNNDTHPPQPPSMSPTIQSRLEATALLRWRAAGQAAILSRIRRMPARNDPGDADEVCLRAPAL